MITNLNQDSNHASWYLGLMSGTSCDGIDAALVLMNKSSIERLGPSIYQPMPDELRGQLLALQGAKNEDDSCERLLSELHIEICQKLIKKTGIHPTAIGFHGQTITHDPADGFSLQIGDGKLLAQTLKIPVVWDFRSYDITQGGEGAPLAPAYHQAIGQRLRKRGFLTQQNPVIFVNIGGVSNVTLIDFERSDIMAFDTGPGNALIDDYMHQHFNQPIDKNGETARSGTIDQLLLQTFLAHPWFQKKPPKSLDRNFFKQFDVNHLKPCDGVATLTALSAFAIAKATDFCTQKPQAWIICGGGRHNHFMLEQLHKALDLKQKKVNIYNLDQLDPSFNLNGDMLEAQAFAYMAALVLNKKCFAWPSTTGVNKPHGVAKISYP
ncbi:MAG: anhydro-N-acetylmuramic acid kinase [Pseudomonadota bacterium]